MKQLFVVMLLLFLPVAMVAENQHMKFTHDGEFASFSMNSAFSSTFLSVSRDASNGAAPTATLNYSAVTVAADFNSESFVQIIGTIPASAFTGQTTQHLVLDFDTSQLDPSTSFSQSCTLDLTTFNESCGPAPTGTIHLEFSENGVQRTQVLDFDEVITNGSTTTHIHQTSDNSTANMQGTIFNVPFSIATATVGVNHQSTLEVIKGAGTGDGDDDKDKNEKHDRDRHRDHDRDGHGDHDRDHGDH